LTLEGKQFINCEGCRKKIQGGFPRKGVKTSRTLKKGGFLLERLWARRGESKEGYSTVKKKTLFWRGVKDEGKQIKRLAGEKPKGEERGKKPDSREALLFFASWEQGQPGFVEPNKKKGEGGCPNLKKEQSRIKKSHSKRVRARAKRAGEGERGGGDHLAYAVQAPGPQASTQGYAYLGEGERGTIGAAFEGNK